MVNFAPGGKNLSERQNLRLTFSVYWSVLVVQVSALKSMNSVSTVMFTGNVTHKLDPKSRVAIPAGWRDAQGAVLWMIDAQNEGYPTLKCYTRESFEEMVNGIRSHAEARGFDPAAVNRYLGTIIGLSFEAEVSSQGKLLIPKAQRERLKLADTATIVGRGSYFEIWSPVDFEATKAPDALAKLELDKVFGILT